MFVTEEERRPLGGIFGFVLPMALIGAGAGASTALVGQGVITNQHLGGIVAISAFLLMFWTASAPLRSVLAALIGAVLVLMFLALDIPALRPAGTALAALAFVALAGAWIDHRPASGLPAYRLIFARALSLPPMVLIVGLLAGLSAIFVGALFQITDEAVAEALNNPGLEEARALATRAAVASAVVGGVVGLSAALVRSQRVLIGALRFAILMLARYGGPVLTVLGVVVVVIAIQDELMKMQLAPLFVVLALALFSVQWLVFQNLVGPRPPLWLMLSSALGSVVGGALLAMVWSLPPDAREILMPGPGPMIFAGLSVVTLGALPLPGWRKVIGRLYSLGLVWLVVAPLAQVIAARVG